MRISDEELDVPFRGSSASAGMPNNISDIIAKIFMSKTPGWSAGSKWIRL
jgi:hypothetical protein